MVERCKCWIDEKRKKKEIRGVNKKDRRMAGSKC